MRFYLGSCEMKWSHSDRMEQIWIQRELGDDLFNEIQQDCYEVVIIRSNSWSMPGDTYKRCDILVDIEDKHRAFMFALKHSTLTKIEIVNYE